MHLAARPQVNLRSMGRRRFAHLSDQGDEIHVDANIPWGSTTLFTLEFRDDSRLYAIHTANNRYLSRDGRLLEQCNATCLFSLEYHAGALALRDTQGLYLAPLGSKVCCSLSLSAFIVIDFCIPRISLPFSLPPPSFYEIGRLGGTEADCVVALVMASALVRRLIDFLGQNEKKVSSVTGLVDFGDSFVLEQR